MSTKRGAWSGGTLRPDQWPDADRLSWERACANDDPDDPGAAGYLAPTTRVHMCQEYGQFLAWLRKTGRLDPARSGADQLTAEVLGAFLADARPARSDVSVFSSLDGLAMILPRLMPERQWRWICHHPRAPRPRHVRAARRPPRTFDVGLLVHKLMEELERLDALPATARRAEQRRDCLIVAVGAYTALRRRNLSALTLGRSFIRRSDTWRIRFAAWETKTGQPIQKNLPLSLVTHMDRYVRTDRPRLIGSTSTQALWVTGRSSRKFLPPAQVGKAFLRVGQALLGHPITPHQTRYTAATTLLKKDPSALRIASAVLTHADPNTVPAFYDQSGTEAAQDIWQQMRHGITKPGGKRHR